MKQKTISHKDAEQARWVGSMSGGESPAARTDCMQNGRLRRRRWWRGYFTDWICYEWGYTFRAVGLPGGGREFQFSRELPRSPHLAADCCTSQLQSRDFRRIRLGASADLIMQNRSFVEFTSILIMRTLKPDGSSQNMNFVVYKFFFLYWI